MRQGDRQATVDSERPAVLAIDDDPEILLQVSHILRNEPFRVLTARDPNEGLRLFEAERPRVVLLDINMGGLDGYAVLDRIMSAAGRAVRVLMLTGRDSQADVEAALQRGARDYLIKPVDPAYLLSRVAEYMDQESEGS